MEFNNVVTLPTNVITRREPDFVRPSEDGNIPCYVNPTDQLVFQYLDPRQQMFGSVKAYNSNNPDNEELLLTDCDDVLVPGEFFFKNGLVCLNVMEDSVEYYYWDPITSDYVYMNTFTTGKINYLAPRVINSNVIQVQINDTIWTLRHGRPFVYVQHPYSDINYELKGVYAHDSQTTNFPSSDEDISMQTVYYTNIIDAADNLLDPNAATGTNSSQNINGFSGYGTTIASSTDWASIGTRSLKVTCLGTQVSERAWAWSLATPIIGNQYTAQITFKGAVGEQFIVQLQLLNSPYSTFTGSNASVAVTATGSTQTVIVSGTCPASATQIGVLIRKDPTISTNPFYIGSAVLVSGSNIPYGTMNMTTGDIEKDYRQLIVKTTPTTIKSDFIPSDDITIIGHYDKNAIGYDKASSMVKECFLQVVQYSKPLKV